MSSSVTSMTRAPDFRSTRRVPVLVADEQSDGMAGDKRDTGRRHHHSKDTRALRAWWASASSVTDGAPSRSHRRLRRKQRSSRFDTRELAKEAFEVHRGLNVLRLCGFCESRRDVT